MLLPIYQSGGSVVATEVTKRPVDFEVTVGALGGSLRVTVPSQIAKELSLSRGDTVLMSLVQVGPDETSKGLLTMKKGK